MRTANLQYKDILSSIKPEMERFEEELTHSVISSDILKEDFKGFINAPSKRIRPVLMFLVLKAMGLEIKDEHYKIAVATELLHAATLVHDDVIDKAQTRRGQEAWHLKYDSKLAVLAGDTLLAIALKTLSGVENTGVFRIFSKNVLDICRGEVSQYFSRFRVPFLGEYLEKSMNKTALLFLCAVEAALLVSGVENERAEEFTVDFGTAFQMKNDLETEADIENGIYTLSAIYFKHENPNCDIIDLTLRSKEKARAFLNDFTEKASKKLDFTDNNKEIKKLLMLMAT